MEQDVKPEGIVLKFERFRSIAEIFQKKYKEAATVIERLQDECNSSKDVEKNIRNQLNEAQNRLIHYQENQKKLMKENHEKLEESAHLLERNTFELQKQIKENEEKSKKLSEATVREINLQKQIGQLNAALKEKEGDLDIIKAENKMLEDEKFLIITEYEEKITQLQDELKNSRKELIDLKVYSDRTLQKLREQVKEYEKKIENFEKEAENRAGEYELPKEIFNKSQPSGKENLNQSNKQDKRVTWADSTVSSIFEESGCRFDSDPSIDNDPELSKELARIGTLMDKKNSKQEARSKRQFLPKVKKEMNKNLKVGGKQKPQLHFIESTSEDNTQENLIEKITIPKRRRLYVDNGDFIM